MPKEWFESLNASELNKEDIKIMLEEVEDLSQALLETMREYYDNSTSKVKGQVTMSSVLSAIIKFLAITAPCTKAARDRCQLLSEALIHPGSLESIERLFYSYLEMQNEDEDDEDDE